MSESEDIAAAAPPDTQRAMDSEDRLRPEFVDKVLDAVDAGDDVTARALVEPLHPADLAGQMDTDDAVAILEDLEEDEQRAVLQAMEPDDRAAIEEALTYPEESAGRLMQRDLIAVPEHWTVGRVIDFLRAGDDLTTDFWEVFVVDERHHPVGTCLLSWILRT